VRARFQENQLEVTATPIAVFLPDRARALAGDLERVIHDGMIAICSFVVASSSWSVLPT
jgi:hypothetical protein